MNLVRNNVLAALALIVILIGAFFKWPFAKYLGETVGVVLLSFLLPIWWQEKEKQLSKKEKNCAFWENFKKFIPIFERKVDSQRGMTSYDVFDNIFEHRLPLQELIDFGKQANELGLDTELRRKISEMVQYTKSIEEYIDSGADGIKLGGKWRSNFQSLQERLYGLVLEIKSNKAVCS